MSFLKPFTAGGDGYLHPTAVYVENKQKWEVSRILWHKGLARRRKYLVVYSGYSKSKAFFLLESEFSHDLKIMNNYKVSHGLF